MRKRKIIFLCTLLCSMLACTPRDFLTRRLAATLIAGSNAFKIPQQFWIRTGTVSNKEYMSPESLVLQRHGWITGANVPCPADINPPPCWEVSLSPLGVDTFRGLIPNNTVPSNYFSVVTAKRELIAITGISKEGNLADVEFTWKWMPLNEVGAALEAGSVRYNSTVGFKRYDDGWRLVENDSPKNSQSIEEALKNAEPAQ